MISSGEPSEDAAGPGARLTAICAGTRSMEFASMSRQAGFSSPAATGGPRSASRRSPGEYRSRSQAWSITVERHGFGWRLVALPRRDSQVAATAQPRVRPSAYTSSRSRTSRTEPRDLQVRPPTISPGHHCRVLRDRVASLRGKYIPQLQVDALLSLHRRHVTRGHPIGARYRAHHVGSKTWLSLGRGIARTVAAVYRWATGIGPLGGHGSRIRSEVGWIHVALARSARRVSFECRIANA
jgi:hypothetical protein